MIIHPCLLNNIKFMLKLKPAVFFTLILAIFLGSTSFVAIKKLPAKAQIDTSKIQVKSFDSNAIKKLLEDKDFNYTDAHNAGQPSFWERFWNWLWNILFGWIDKSTIGGSIMKYILLTLSISFLVFVVFQSLGIDPIKLWQGEAKKINVPYSESLENIHEINFDGEIEKSVSQRDYRLAVRLLYLRSLKQLSDAHLIQWQIDKTNSAYVYELTDPVQKQTFGLLTRQFEYVWYGDFPIDQQAFVNINQLFQSFKKQLV
jgi:ABC-type dipeptide/oligopeptide/nickel transport system permease component